MRDRFLLTGVALVAISFTPMARAQPSIPFASLSPDTAVDLDEAGGGDFADEDVAVDNLLGVTIPANVGSLPAGVDVSGYELLPNGDQLLCFDTTVELPGPAYVPRGDVVRYDGVSYATEFDASANGVTAGAVCDGIAQDAEGRLLLSFDITVELPDGVGGTLTAADEDVVQVDGASSFTLIDASPLGVPVELDADGFDSLANGDFVTSYDTGGVLGGVVFEDEDLLHIEAATGVWSLLVEASAQDADWVQADVDALAVPESDGLLMLASGIAFLAATGAQRARR